MKLKTLALLVISFIFTLINYSENTWNLFYSLGGLALAKVGPEVLGIIFFCYFAFFFWKKEKIKKGLSDRKDWTLIFFLFLITFLTRIPQFKTDFFRDDVYFWLIRSGEAGYSVYTWGPWLSSHPGWAWELSRLIGGSSPFTYQIATILSHFLFVVGVYFLAKYLSRDKYIGLASAVFFSITTIHFEAFEWLSHVTNFGWQGLLMTLALLALVWQLDENKGLKTPYISTFLMMSAFGSGLARTGAIPIVIFSIDTIYSFKFFGFKKIKEWLASIVKRQWLTFSLVFTFLVTRNLLSGPSTRIEEVKAPLSQSFLWLFGVFSFPPEFINLFGFISNYWLGTIMIVFSFLVLMGFLFVLIRRKYLPLSIWVGLVWTLSFALYYTFWGPHVPVTKEALQIRIGPHHLAYPSAVGVSLIVGYLLIRFGKRAFDTLSRKIPRKMSLLVIVLCALLLMAYDIFNLYNLYDNFVENCLRQKNYILEICKP